MKNKERKLIMENKDMIDDKLILENTDDFQNEIIIENEMLKELTNGKEMIENGKSGKEENNNE